jgi:hypothetical protein
MEVNALSEQMSHEASIKTRFTHLYLVLKSTHFITDNAIWRRWNWLSKFRATICSLMEGLRAQQDNDKWGRLQLCDSRLNYVTDTLQEVDAQRVGLPFVPVLLKLSPCDGFLTALSQCPAIEITYRDAKCSGFSRVTSERHFWQSWWLVDRAS